MKANDYRPKTLQEAIEYFANPQVATAFVVNIHWPDGVTCPRCECKDVSHISTRQIWQCKSCKKQFSVKAGTIFEDSPLPLKKWLAAMWLITSAKNGISSYELHRALGITQKSAWFMLHRIRLAMQNGSIEKFSGQVEADETFIGGKSKNMHKDKRKEKIKGRGATGKAVVMGLLERSQSEKASKVKTKHIKNTKRVTLHREIAQRVEHGSEVFTDALPSYEHLNSRYIHQAIDHAVAYAVGNVHTNGLENFWSLSKRSIRGTYVHVNAEHLFRYLDEQAFRFNERKGQDDDRFIEVLSSVKGRRLTYKELISDTKRTVNKQVA